MNRTDGYTTDVSYPAFFYKEMQPVWLCCVAHFLGFAAPDLTRPFTFCELGCGTGTNLLVAAASHPQARFVGVDFNENHLQTARAAALSSGLENVEFIGCSFQEFATGHHTPFDFITTHGVWSWIAPEHQSSLLDCVQVHLKPGGLFYLHYMCHPGSTELATLQHFLNLFAHHIPGTSAQRAQTGLKLLRQLSDRGLFTDQPAVLKHLRNLERLNPNHVAHEFLTDHWQPQHSVAVHQRIGQAGLGYLGSADVFHNLDTSLSVPGPMQAVIRQTQAPALAETLKDMARHSHQRMDLFQREPQPLGQQKHLAQLGEMLFQPLPDTPMQGPISFATPIGNIEGPENIFSPLLQSLATGPASFARLAQLPAFAGQPGALLQALQLLMRQEIVHPLKPAPATTTAHAERLTQWFRRNGISLQTIEPCGTAILPHPTPSPTPTDAA